MKKRNGFTLVELLAVIVILAIILVIAVPQIMTTIDDARQASLESSVKMVAAAAENQYTVAQTLDKIGQGTGKFDPGASDALVDCGEWSGIDTEGSDYASCQYYIDTDGTAHVTVVGKDGGKFAKFTDKGCTGTRTSVECTEDSES